jgi:hypothetical protein
VTIFGLACLFNTCHLQWVRVIHVPFGGRMLAYQETINYSTHYGSISSLLYILFPYRRNHIFTKFFYRIHLIAFHSQLFQLQFPWTFGSISNALFTRRASRAIFIAQHFHYRQRMIWSFFSDSLLNTYKKL